MIAHSNLFLMMIRTVTFLPPLYLLPFLQFLLYLPFPFFSPLFVIFLYHYLAIVVLKITLFYTYFTVTGNKIMLLYFPVPKHFISKMYSCFVFTLYKHGKYKQGMVSVTDQRDKTYYTCRSHTFCIMKTQRPLMLCFPEMI